MKYLFLLLILLIGSSTPAQDETKLNSTYIELFGNGIWVSGNYERILFNGDFLKPAIRSGITLNTSGWEEYPILFPLEIISIIGRNKHMAEFSFGYTGAIRREQNRRHVTLVHNFMLRLGYRHEPVFAPVVLRVGFTPFIYYPPLVTPGSSSSSIWTFVPFGGVAFGIKF